MFVTVCSQKVRVRSADGKEKAPEHREESARAGPSRIREVLA